MKPYDSYLIGQAAVLNAKDYSAQAELLAERSWYGRAQALAVLGQEEVGKAMYFTLLSLGGLRYKPKAIQQMFGDHTAKQRMSHMWLGMSELLGDTSLQAFVKEALGPLISNLPDSLTVEAEERLRTSLAELPTRLDAIAEATPSLATSFEKIKAAAVEALQAQTLDPDKWAGLYVDYDAATGSIRIPSAGSLQNYDQHASALRRKLTICDELFPVIPDGYTLTRFRALAGMPPTLEEQA
jgi:AbiV family abortive infection protein